MRFGIRVATRQQFMRTNREKQGLPLAIFKAVISYRYETVTSAHSLGALLL